MEDKTFELLTKMYSEFSEKFEVLAKEQKRQGAILENDIKNGMKALFDGYNQVYEEVKDVKQKVTDISSRVEKQDVEIRVIKGGK